MRDGVSGQMVQHAIAQRQQQAQSQAQIQAQQSAQAAYRPPQQYQGYQDSHGQLGSSATWNAQQQLGQNVQWTGHYAPGQSGANFPQPNSSQQYNPSYMGYYGHQNGYHG